MSFTRLRYHIVFATKERTPWISPEVEYVLYPLLGNLTRTLGGRLIRVGGVEDHIHLINAIPATLSVADFVRDLKSRSSAALHRRFEHLESFKWQRGFGCFSLNPMDMAGIVAYVENQKDHHRREAICEAWELIS